MDEAILMIDDDELLVEALRGHIEQLGYMFAAAHDGKTGLELANSRQFRLLILDRSLPDTDGIEILRKLRDSGADLPVLVLSSRADEVDKVLGLDSGADDYLAKPFGVSELLSRIKALLRRGAANATSGSFDEIRVGELRIELQSRRVFARGEEVELRPLEYELLLFLASSPGRVFTREQVLEAVWQTQAEGYEKAVNTCINRLRNVIELDPRAPKYILTIWGVGYRFASEHDLAGES